VIARHEDDRTPAIGQYVVGKGTVTISGPHPESPQSWRTKLGLVDTDGLDHEIAWNLIEAAMNKKALPVY
jgi:hypothetical protein